MSRRRRSGSPLSLFSFQDIITSVTAILLLITLLLIVELTQRQPAAAPVVDVEPLQREIAAVEAQLADAEELLETLTQAATETAAATPVGLHEQIVAAEAAAAALRSQLAALGAAQAEHEDARQQLETQQQQRAGDYALLNELQQQAAALEGELAELRTSEQRFYRPDETSGLQAWLLELRSDRWLVARPGEEQAATLLAGNSPAQRLRQLESFARQSSPRRDFFVVLAHPTGVAEFDRVYERLGDLGFSLGFDILGEEELVLSVPGEGAGP